MQTERYSHMLYAPSPHTYTERDSDHQAMTIQYSINTTYSLPAIDNHIYTPEEGKLKLDAKEHGRPSSPCRHVSNRHRGGRSTLPRVRAIAFDRFLHRRKISPLPRRFGWCLIPSEHSGLFSQSLFVQCRVRGMVWECFSLLSSAFPSLLLSF